MVVVHYDPGYKGWYVYGLGTVMPGSNQVIPDTGISIHEFTGAMVAPPSLKPAEGKACRDSASCSKGDPVDLQTGIFQMENRLGLARCNADHVDANLPDSRHGESRLRHRRESFL